jgi:hypothetical protein
MSDRSVFDCMVFLQAVLNEDSPAFRYPHIAIIDPVEFLRVHSADSEMR